MNKWVAIGVGVALLAVAAIAVKGCDAKKAGDTGSTSASGTTEPVEAKKQIGDLFTGKAGAPAETPVEVPKVKLNAIGDEVLGKAAVLTVVEENERVMDFVFLDDTGKRLAKYTTDGLPKMQGNLSADRKWITFVTAPETKPPRYDIWACTLDGKTAILLTEDFPPQKELVDSRDQGKGAKVRRNGCPSFTADGKKVIFATTVIGEPSNLVSVAREGGSRTMLTNAEAKTDHLKYSSPQCSPTSDDVLFSRSAGKTARSIIRMTLKTKEEKEVVPTEEAQFENPRWSPDGNSFAYTERAEKFDRYWLHVCNADGSKDRKIATPESIHSGSFAFGWFPDGSKIAYSATDGRQDDLYAVDVASGAITRLTQTPEREAMPIPLR
ncbi:MAG: PD40 domain-containing protein [Planctomycetes bacterium]|nr:PD40 domain-containing protein [Planctomycetota bacterium]MBI3846834.1 PD40 domain-containing protein [Planctomycetota bacterium]